MFELHRGKRIGLLLILIVLISMNKPTMGMNPLSNLIKTPGQAGNPLKQLPKTTSGFLGQKPGRPTFLVFVHPQCPCLETTAHQIEILRTQIIDEANFHALVCWPEDKSIQWTNSESTQKLAQVRTLTVTLDRNGNKTTEFGICTSGHLLVYGCDEQLLFSGGLIDPDDSKKSSSHSGYDFEFAQSRRRIDKVRPGIRITHY